MRRSVHTLWLHVWIYTELSHGPISLLWVLFAWSDSGTAGTVYIYTIMQLGSNAVGLALPCVELTCNLGSCTFGHIYRESSI